MSDDNHELSDEEYDALLSDLEGRASGGGGDVDLDEDVGDIDDFLADLDSGDSSPSPSTDTDGGDDDLAREFADLEEKGELSAPKKGKMKGPKKAENVAKKEGADGEAKDGEAAAPSRGKRIALAAVKSVLWFTPPLVLWWVVGAHLGQWISAGWLIALVATAFVFAIPAALNQKIERGSYKPWLLGYSVVLTALLIAPIAHVAGENISSYGHWPASAVAEVVGADSDAGFVRTTASATESVGGWMAPADELGWQGRELGTAFPLGMEWPQEELMPLLEDGELEPGQLEEALRESED